MNHFVHPILLWGLALLALPVLIHLINLLRHRRVAWAAMEFLLASQKKNSTWIRLKELLLLLLRLAAVAAIVLLAAQPLLYNQWAALFGGAKTHHIVLLDDSFSTSDRWADTSAFVEARKFVEKLAAQAVRRRGQQQTFTLLRFSRARREGRGTQPDLLEELVGADFAARVAETLAPLEPSQTAAGPAAALDSIDQLLGDAPDETRIVYLVSDFRQREWREPEGLARHLSRLTAQGIALHLVHTVETARPNLAIAELAPAAGTRAAGVPLFMDVTVANFSDSAVRDVAVHLKEDDLPDRAPVVIDRIDANKSVTRRFSVTFTAAGEHRVSARIEGDNVPADSRRHAVVSLPLSVPVLIVDGNPDAPDGRIVGAALAPGGAVNTGIAPRIELPVFLNNHPLAEFHSVYLCNVRRLDAPAIDSLENYVRAGGGVAFFLGGPEVEEDYAAVADFYNKHLHRQGVGLFPVELTRPTELFVDRLEQAPDLETSDHPVFHIFSGERNSFLGMVKVQRYFGVPEGWKPSPDGPTRLIARLRNSAPLALDHAFGQGRVVAFLTSAAPSWNDWAKNPSFVVAVLEMQSYLTAPRHADESRVVGAPLALLLDPARYQARVGFVRPGERGGDEATSAVPVAGGLAATFTDTDVAGVYEARLRPTSGDSTQTRRFAYNVLADEGDLATVTGEQLAASLPGVRFDYQQAGAFEESAVREQAGFNLADGLLVLLVALLVGEQLLAWSASYHPATQGARR